MTTVSSLPFPFDHLGALQTRYGLKLPHIAAAIELSTSKRLSLEAELRGACTDNCSLVLCGSLGRFEATSSSDIDWNLLIDGPVEARHRETANSIREQIKGVHQKEKIPFPNAAGPFAGMIFSHELVHAIGGDDDTNKNITRRMLLLLEAHAIAQPLVLDRVVNNILERYLEHDRQIYRQIDQRDYFPRFMLNDIVRFWRTMAVDCAAKRDTRGANEWAIRNAKLRFSRKLLFVAGLLLAYEAVLSAPPRDDRDHLAQQSPGLDLISRIQVATKLPPLEALARAIDRFPEWDGAGACARKIFQSYDTFLGTLTDKTTREELKRVSLEQAASHAIFQDVRTLSRTFQEGLDAFFYAGPSAITQLTFRYSLF